MFQQLSQGALNVIASAVTPAVMISASAILISGISSKHSATSDRLRSLTEERRHPETSVSRRRSIEAQCALFLRRLRLILIGHLLLYGATALFVAMVFAIAASPLVGSYWVVFALFLAGVSTLLGALVFEMLELRLATRTLALETSDAMTEKTIKENPG